MHRTSRKSPAPRAPRPAQTPPAPPLTNLEMAGDRLKVYSLQTLLTNKRNPETRATARLGDVLLPWFEKVVNKPGEKLDGIIELWLQLLPENLKNRSRLLGLNRGVLSVAVDSATIRSEIDARLRAGLLRELQTGSKGAIFKVKTSVQALRLEPHG